MKICKEPILLIPFRVFWTGLTLAALLAGGCESPPRLEKPPLVLQGFTIRKVRISALTDFVISDKDPDQSEIKTYVELLDTYDSQLKKPCIFRFELYAYKALTNNPRGKRLTIWSDIDLTNPAENNQYWKDYLRSYAFYLPLGFSPRPEQNYLLEVTCLSGEKRFSDVFKIRYQP